MNRAVTPTGYLRLNWLAAKSRSGAEVALRVFYIALPFFIWTAVAIFLGFLVGFSAVILPPTGTFGIVAAVGLVLLWVTPDLPQPPIRALPIVFAIVFFCMLCIPNYYAIDIPGLPWITFRRLSLIALIVPLAIAAGGSSRFRADILKKLASERLVSICVIGFLVWSVLSILASINHSQSLASVVDDALTYYVPFFVCLYLFTSTAKVERFIKIFCWYSLFVAVLGIVEFRLQRRFYFDIMPRWYLESLMEANPAVAAMVTANPFRNGQYRASSIFTVPLSFGEFAMMSAPLGWYFLVHGTGTMRRLFGVVVTVASFLGIFASGSRGAYMGLFGAFLGFVLLWIVRNARQHPGSIVTAFASVVGACATVVILAAVEFSGRLHAMVFGSSAIDQASTDARWAQWANLKPKLWASPIFGHGRGMSGDTISYYYPGAMSPTVDSYTLTLLADVGFPGTFFFYGIIVFGVLAGTRQYIFGRSQSGTLAGALSCSLIAFGVYRTGLSAQENFFPFFMFVAAIIAINAANPIESPPLAPSKRKAQAPGQERSMARTTAGSRRIGVDA